MCQFPKTINTYVPTSRSYGMDCVPRLIRLKVPCGHCLECKALRANQWTWRLEEEAKNWKYVSFICLTYSSSNVPVLRNIPVDGSRSLSDQNISRGYYSRSKNDKLTLFYRDVQLFLKILRHHVRFKFFAVGEYGTNGTVRPHYHIILFTDDLASKELYPLIAQIWNKGRVSCGDCTNGGLSYVANYCSGANVDVVEHHVPPFLRCSLRPAIGLSWLSSPMAMCCKERGETSIKKSFVDKQGKRLNYTLPIPRSFRKWMDMGKCYEDLLILNDETFIKETKGISKTKTLICGGKLKVDVSYDRKCRESYFRLVTQHGYREDYQHIKFSYSQWLTFFHRFVLNDHHERPSDIIRRLSLLLISDA